MESFGERMSRLAVEFAQAVCLTLKEMIGVDYSIPVRHCSTGPLSNINGTVALLHFGGSVQGDCVLAVSHKTAVRLIECFLQKNGSPHFSFDRGMIDELIGVILNNSVGRLMSVLEMETAANSFMPPIIASGNVTFPKVTSNGITIRGVPGNVTCVLMLNMSGFEAVQTLTTLSDDRIKETVKASVDLLTGLKTRRYFDEYLPMVTDSIEKAGSTLSIMIIAVDHFERINIMFGSQTVNLVLAMVAQAVMATLRGEDVACRYGEDEIVVVLPNTVLENALHVRERIRDTLGRKTGDLRNRDPQLPEITISVGIAELQENETRESLFARAGKALYDSKKERISRIFSKQT